MQSSEFINSLNFRSNLKKKTISTTGFEGRDRKYTIYMKMIFEAKLNIFSAQVI